MSNRDTAFVGSIPHNYDRYLGPMIFHAFADDLAERLRVVPGMRVLETACGTGILTERLVRRLAGRGVIVATDLNEPMLAYAKQKRVAESGLEWRPADGTKLPFEDGSFDAVLCQFGLMFFPDKIAGVREAFRVLKPRGQYLLNTWDAIGNNPFAKITHETVTSYFPSDPPQFYQLPFSLYDPDALCSWLGDVGFEGVEWQALAKTGVSGTAAEAAIGLIEGNPLYNTIMDRRPDALEDIKAAVTRNLIAAFGDHPLRCPLRVFVFTATRP